MNSIDCTVIIPAYNAEKDILRTLNSFCVNSDRNYKLEILIINDGSTDNTEEIVNKFSFNNPLCKIINKTNGGVSSARNLGLKYAQGDYVCFCDSDDEMDREILDDLLDKAFDYRVDLVVASYEKFINEQSEIVICDFLSPKNCVLNRDYIEKEIFKQFMWGGNVGLSSVCNKIFKRKVIIDNNLLFDINRTHGEDWAFNVGFFECCKSLYVSNLVLYKYYVQPSYDVEKYGKNTSQNFITAHQMLIDLNNKYNICDKKSEEYMIWRARFFYRIATVIKMDIYSRKEKRQFLNNTIVKDELNYFYKIKLKDYKKCNFRKRYKIAMFLMILKCNFLAKFMIGSL